MGEVSYFETVYHKLYEGIRTNLWMEGDICLREGCGYSKTTYTDPPRCCKCGVDPLFHGPLLSDAFKNMPPGSIVVYNFKTEEDRPPPSLSKLIQRQIQERFYDRAFTTPRRGRKESE